MNVKIETIEVDGVPYYTQTDFATLISRTVKTVSNLMTKGNCIRKLKSVHHLGRPLIPASELYEFPFTLAGRYAAQHVYRFHKHNDYLVLSDVTMEYRAEQELAKL